MAKKKIKTEPKNLSTLVSDIKNLLAGVSEGKGVQVDPKRLAILGATIALKIEKGLQARTAGKRPPKTIFMSELGTGCKRKLWYQVNESTHGPYDKEPLEYSTLIKFMYGDILEELVLFLAEQAGHEVTDQQKLVEIPLKNGWKVRGRLDAKIDGSIIDVKSASSYSFKKFQRGLTGADDPFGYLDQLAGYALGEKVEEDGLTAFVAINKETGALAVDALKVGKPASIASLDAVVDLLEADKVPDRGYSPSVQPGGNEKLCTECSYCAFKHECWQDANEGKGIRTFIYANRPEFLVKIKTVPKVPEVTRGKTKT